MPVLRSSAVLPKTINTSFAKPYTRAQARIEQEAGISPALPLQPPISNKKRSRQPDFGIFVDTDAANTSCYPSPKKLRSNERIPLTARPNSGNVTPAPSPCLPGITLPSSPSDPGWVNVENCDPCPVYMTPPSTPRSLSPTPSPNVSPHRPSRPARPRHAHRSPSQRSIPPPKDMTLYRTLDLNSWRATAEEIKAAHRNYAREHHPDKVAPEMREEATHLMQVANAAVEVLLDSERRRAYHRTGKLPWTT